MTFTNAELAMIAQALHVACAIVTQPKAAAMLALRDRIEGYVEVQPEPARRAETR